MRKRLDGPNTPGGIIKRQSARAPERQSARAPERQSARAPERQSARAPERQSARAHRCARSGLGSFSGGSSPPSEPSASPKSSRTPPERLPAGDGRRPPRSPSRFTVAGLARGRRAAAGVASSAPDFLLRLPRAASLLAPLALALTVLVSSFGGGAWAQAENPDPVCKNSPSYGERVDCRETGNSDTIDLDLVGVTISTTAIQQAGNGVFTWKDGPAGTGDIKIDFTNGSITTTGDTAAGIGAWHYGTGDIVIYVRKSTLKTGGHGIDAASWGFGDVTIDVRDSSITSSLDSGKGVFGQVGNGLGSGSAGDLAIDIRDTHIKTSGEFAHGVDGLIQSPVAGNLRIRIEGGSIATSGGGAVGIEAAHAGTGDIDVQVVGASVSTTGDRDSYDFPSMGVFGWHSGVGKLRIRIEGGSTVTTSGAGAHGVAAIGSGAVDVLIRNAVIRASGAGSDGIRVLGGGTQTVTVDGEVWGGSGGAAGIRLIGGGRVIIGPDGRIGADSGAAILVTRADSTDSSERPPLHLDLMLDGRLPEKVLGGRIANDDGTTALTVNGVRVFDGAADGARNVWVPNGAWNVRATGTDLSTLAFARVVAPRAAVYEALPGVLLRLDEPGGVGDEGRLRSPDTPVWVRIAGGVGSYRADSATVDARYSHTRYSVESGMDFPLDYELTGWHGLTGWAGVRMISGSAEVSAPTGGGRIEAAGYGLTGGLAWKGEDDWYGTGRLSLTRYSADLFSAARGGLKSGVSGMIHALDLEGGRRFDLDLGVKTRLTARGVLRGSGVSLGKFNDGLFSQVSIKQADRLAAGAGVAVETGLLPSEGVDRLVLRGSLDAEQALSAGTKVDVSGTALESKAGGTGFGVGFGGAYRIGGYTLGGSVEAGGLGSDDTAFSGRLEARMAF